MTTMIEMTTAVDYRIRSIHTIHQGETQLSLPLDTCVGSEIAFLSKSCSLHIIVYKSTHLYAIICKEHDLGERDLEPEGCRDRVPSINRDVWFTMQ